MAIDNTNLVMFRDNTIASQMRKHSSVSARAKHCLHLYFYFCEEIAASLDFSTEELEQVLRAIQHIQITETKFLPVVVRGEIKDSELGKALINKVLVLSNFEIVVLSEMTKNV